MQFVKDGPDIPDRLLQWQEEGRVVFFCGAGISYPAGLPNFPGLVEKTYQKCTATRTAVQNAAIKAKQYDIAVGLLESYVQEGRIIVRQAIAEILKPDLTRANAKATQEALLQLGKTRKGQTRLVTTNFDRLFEEVISGMANRIPTYKAPLLPVPKAKWDGLVYLHGLLTEKPTESDLNCLVVTSGDFGLAYLNERWAARFVSELFQNYTVCFVGYSINDPVLRYMMDALAADRQQGESPPEMFAFGSFQDEEEQDRELEWKAKNVTPILYREDEGHTLLHRTLRAWAETYRDGISGKERIVDECAAALPLTGTKQDDFVGRLLWALSDDSGLPARRFADYVPTPSLDWLEPFSEDRFYSRDLPRFGVFPKATSDDKPNFSLIHRPSPHDLSPRMSLFDGRAYRTGWDKVMTQVARWLSRHLDNPKLLLWLAKRNGILHDELKIWIERALEEVADLERRNDKDGLAKLAAQGPNSIPSPAMRTLWRLLLTGRIRSPLSDTSLFGWKERFQRDGLTASIRFDLRRSLTPYVMLSDPIGFDSEAEEVDGTPSIRNLVESEIVLATKYAHSMFDELNNVDSWIAALPLLLEDFSALLRDALDLMNELGRAEDESDLSYLHQPSIADHPQNQDFRDWTILIDLTRDAWIETAKNDRQSAAEIADRWFRTPYPIFRRLAFFAATQPDVISPDKATRWLLDRNCWWLWSIETERESFRLLVGLATKASPSDMTALQQAILIGPPRTMFKADISEERWSQLVDREVWLRLAKLSEAGAQLGTTSRRALDGLASSYPEWRLSVDQRDEFPVWMGDASWVGEDSEMFPIIPTPYSGRDLVEWIRKYPSTDSWKQDEWKDRCRKKFRTAAFALLKLARNGEWPTDRWAEALQAWNEKDLVNRSWRYVAPAIVEMPVEKISEIAHGVSSWMQVAAQEFDRHEGMFFKLADRLLDLDTQSGVLTEEPVMLAINHPVGHVTQALLTWWFRKELEDGQGLPEVLRERFTRLCDTTVERFRHGRVLLASRVITIFRVDKDWSQVHLLPLFDWTTSEIEAMSAWEGFLWSPRLYRPLLEELKGQFLDTARHFSALGKHDGQYAAILTYASLDPGDVFSVAELAHAVASLPSDGLNDVVTTLVRALEGSGDQKTAYWDNRISPYLENIWPKTAAASTPQIAGQFARLCIAAGERFPEAFAQLHIWIRQPTNPDFLANRLHESGLCVMHPETALDFLSVVLGDHVQWIWRYETDCLREIQNAAPQLAADQRFVRLVEFVRGRGAEWP
jgi:hypothetical protein